MAAGNVITVQQDFADPENKFGYPATSDYCVLLGPNNNIHLITGQGAPSTNHNNAPLSSLYVDVTNKKLYIMTAAATWVVVGTQT